MNFLKRKRRAFSWLELLIIVAVLAVVSAIFFPATIHFTYKTRINAITAQLRNMANEGRAYTVSRGIRRTTYSTLVREKVFPPAQSVLGETYDHLVFENVGGVLSVHTEDDKAVMIRY